MLFSYCCLSEGLPISLLILTFDLSSLTWTSHFPPHKFFQVSLEIPSRSSYSAACETSGTNDYSHHVSKSPRTPSFSILMLALGGCSSIHLHPSQYQCVTMSFTIRVESIVTILQDLWLTFIMVNLACQMDVDWLRNPLKFKTNWNGFLLDGVKMWMSQVSVLESAAVQC